MRSMWRGVLAAAMIVVPVAAIAQDWPDIAGPWQTTYGVLDFKVTDIKDDKGEVVGKAASAPYKSEGGTVSGALDGSTLVGHWHEPHSSMKRSTKRAGTFYRGRIEFAFNAAVDAYAGKWGYCDETPERGWSGTRVT